MGRRICIRYLAPFSAIQRLVCEVIVVDCVDSRVASHDLLPVSSDGKRAEGRSAAGPDKALCPVSSIQCLICEVVVIDGMGNSILDHIGLPCFFKLEKCDCILLLIAAHN